MNKLEATRKQWLVDRHKYDLFGACIADRLRAETRKLGVWAEVSHRAKDMDSLLRKLIKKPLHTYDSLSDKVGVRIIVRYKKEIDGVLARAGQLFHCADTDDKAQSMEVDQVGYLSVHTDVRLHIDDDLAAEFPPNTFGCELQIRTMAQHLWSEMSHDTFYKNDETLSPLPFAVRRSIFVLSGVVELADQEFDRVNSVIPSNPELLLLKRMERHYFTLTSRRGDSEVSLSVIRLLLPLYASGAAEVANHLDGFWHEREEVLRAVYEEAADSSDRSAFLYQPEALMIYDRLRDDPIGTREAWGVQYPDRELERIANAFGISFD